MAFKQLLRGSLGDPKEPSPAREHPRSRADQKAPDSSPAVARTNVLYLTGDGREGKLVSGAFTFAHPHLHLDLSVELKDARARLGEPGGYDALVIGWSVPESEGVALIAHVREQRHPLAVVAAAERSLERYRQAGADQCVPRGGAFLSRLPAAIDEALKQRRASVPPSPSGKVVRVAYAGDVEQIKADLGAAGSSLQVVPLSQALRDSDVRAKDAAVDFRVVVIDHGAHDSQTATLLADVRARNLDVPIVLLVGPMDERSALQIFGPTVDEYIAKTTGWPARLSLRLDTVLARHEQLRELASLRVKEARLRSMVDRLPASILRLSPEGTVLATNAVAQSMLGATSPTMLLRRTFETLIAAEGRETWQEFFRRVCEGDQRSLEVPITTLAGAPRVLDVSAVPVPAELGRALSVLMVLRDVTDRKRLETAVEQVGAAARTDGEAKADVEPVSAPDPSVLRELEGDLHRLADQARTTFAELGTLLREAETRHDSVFARQVDEYDKIKAAQLEHWRAYEAFVQGAHHGVFRATSQLVDANRSFASMLGFDSRDDLLAAGRSIGELTIEEQWRQAVERWRVQADDVVELPWRRKDRGLRMLRLRGRAVTDERHGGECFEVLAEDISAQHALEAQLRRARRWEDAARVTTGIAADLTHTVATLTDSSGVGPGSFRDDAAARRFEEAMARARALCRQLVAFGRREARDPAAIDLNGVVTDMEPVVRRLVDEHIDLSFDLDSSLEAVEAVRPIVEETLVTLVVAARDALPAGGRIAVSTSSEDVESAHEDDLQPGGYIVLSMTATGWGIDTEVRRRLASTAAPAEGDAVVRAFSNARHAMAQAGGCVRAESVPDESLMFKVYLPRAGGEGAGAWESPVRMAL